MSFSTSTVLVQFRLPLGYQIPKGVSVRPNEDYASRALREQSNEHRQFAPVLERNGASLAGTPELLLSAGYRLVEASVQQRTKPRQLKPSKVYLLLSFVFSKEGEHQSSLLEELRHFTAARYEFLKIVRNESEVNNAVLSIVGTTPTGQAVELKQKEDAEAAAYGIVVSRAVPKDERTGHSAPVQPKLEPAPEQKKAARMLPFLKKPAAKAKAAPHAKKPSQKHPAKRDRIVASTAPTGPVKTAMEEAFERAKNRKPLTA
jgi:hypothetical protein